MNQEAKELYRFMEAIGKNPEDLDTRRVFADWLEEHDEPELADYHRKYCTKAAQEKREAERRLYRVAEEHADGDYEGMLKGLMEGDYNFSNDGFRYEIDWEELWKDVETIKGEEVSFYTKQSSNFSCSC
jgi:uncharacterized protein (TIGR02996 family)